MGAKTIPGGWKLAPIMGGWDRNQPQFWDPEMPPLPYMGLQVQNHFFKNIFFFFLKENGEQLPPPPAPSL